MKGLTLLSWGKSKKKNLQFENKLDVVRSLLFLPFFLLPREKLSNETHLCGSCLSVWQNSGVKIALTARRFSQFFRLPSDFCLWQTNLRKMRKDFSPLFWKEPLTTNFNTFHPRHWKQLDWGVWSIFFLIRHTVNKTRASFDSLKISLVHSVLMLHRSTVK